MASLELILKSDKFKAGLQQARDEQGRFIKSNDGMKEGLKKSEGQMDLTGSAAKRLTRVFAGLTAGISATLIISRSVREFATYERTMATVGAVTGASADQFVRLESTARMLGATTAFTAGEAADGLLFLARAGFTVDESIAALPATLNLAIAGMMDLGTAADIASNVASQFGISASNTVVVVDTLVNTANRANTDVLQLAEAMKMAGPVAGSLGRSVEETAAAIGVLGDSGIQASLAGTNLRGIFAALLQPTDQASEALKAMGVSIRDLDPASNSLADITQTLADSNMTAAEAVAIFGRRNAAAALVLARGAEKVAELTESNKGAEGSAKDLADTLNNTLIGSVKSLISALSERAFQILDGPLVEGLKQMTIFIKDVVVVMNGMEDTLSNGVTPGAEAAARAIEGMTAAAAAFLALSMTAKLGSLVTVLGKIPVAIKAIFVALGPIGVIALTISAIIGTLYALRDETVTVGEKTATLADIFAAVWDRIGLIVKAGYEFFVSAAELGVNGVIEVWNLFQSNFTEEFDSMMSAIGLSSNQYFEDVMTGGKMLLNFIIGLVDSIKGIVTDQIKDMTDSFTAAMDFIENPSLSTAKAAGAAALRAAQPLDDIKAAFDDLPEKLFQTDYLGDITQLWADPISQGLINGFSDGVDKIIANSPELQSALEDITKKGFSIDDIMSDAEARASERAERRAEDQAAMEEEAERLAAAASAYRDAQSEIEAALNGGEGNEGASGVDKIKAMRDAMEEYNERVRYAAELNREAAATVVDGFSDAIVQGKSMNDVLSDMSKRFLDLILNAAVFNPMEDALTGMFSGAGFGQLFAGIGGGGGTTPSAQGNVFSKGQLVPFAQGGTFTNSVVNSPTVAPMALFGEAGDEAIMPLRRTPSGDLGVQAGGGGGGGTVKNVSVSVNQTITTNDSDSFRKSKYQTMADARGASRRLAGEL